MRVYPHQATEPTYYTTLINLHGRNNNSLSNYRSVKLALSAVNKSLSYISHQHNKTLARLFDIGMCFFFAVVF